MALLLSSYPILIAKDGTGVFKLDAWVYTHAVSQWHAGGSLYDWYANPEQSLWPFTYPPFAAWLFTPLTWVSDRSSQVLLTLATPVCVALTVFVTLIALQRGHSSSAVERRRLAAGATPWLTLLAVLCLEPVPKTMEYGQINAVLMAAVAVDMFAVRGRGRGVLAGLAAAFKLTPAIAILIFVARREWRAAGTMLASALGVTGLCWLLSPAESAEFFFSAMWDPSRAGFADYSGNQNLKGMVARFLPESTWTPVWALLVLLALAGAGLLLRRLEQLRHGDDGVLLVVQTSVVMLLGLLISPISWSHHWVWIVVALLGFGALAWRENSVVMGILALTGAAVFTLAMQWWFPEQNHVEQDWPFYAVVLGSSYTWWALTAGFTLWKWSGSARQLRPAP